MQKKPVVAVYDKKVGMFDNPFTCRHVGEAVREWGVVKADKNTKYGKNPEDFDLFEIGSYDEVTGSFETHQPHRHLDSGV